MSATVKIDELTDGLEMVSEESAAWLDRQTGRVVIVDGDVISAVEEAEDAGNAGAPEGLSDCQREELPAARGIVAVGKGSVGKAVGKGSGFYFLLFVRQRLTNTLTELPVVPMLSSRTIQSLVAVAGRGVFCFGRAADST